MCAHLWKKTSKRVFVSAVTQTRSINADENSRLAAVTSESLRTESRMICRTSDKDWKLPMFGQFKLMCTSEADVYLQRSQGGVWANVTCAACWPVIDCTKILLTSLCYGRTVNLWPFISGSDKIKVWFWWFVGQQCFHCCPTNHHFNEETSSK